MLVSANRNPSRPLPSGLQSASLPIIHPSVPSSAPPAYSRTGPVRRRVEKALLVIDDGVPGDGVSSSDSEVDAHGFSDSEYSPVHPLDSGLDELGTMSSPSLKAVSAKVMGSGGGDGGGHCIPTAAPTAKVGVPASDKRPTPGVLSFPAVVPLPLESRRTAQPGGLRSVSRGAAALPIPITQDAKGDDDVVMPILVSLSAALQRVETKLDRCLASTSGASKLSAIGVVEGSKKLSCCSRSARNSEALPVDGGREGARYYGFFLETLSLVSRELRLEDFRKQVVANLKEVTLNSFIYSCAAYVVPQLFGYYSRVTIANSVLSMGVGCGISLFLQYQNIAR